VEGVNISSIETIEELIHSFCRFASQSITLKRDVALRIQNEIDILEERCLSVLRKIDNLERLIKEGDNPDEIEEARNQLFEAQREYENIARWKIVVENKLNHYKFKERAFDRLVLDKINEVQIYLKEKMRIVREYSSVRIDEIKVGTYKNPSLGGTIQLSNAIETKARPVGICIEQALPSGFRWMPLREIDLSNELKGIKTSNDFNKNSYQTMMETAKIFEKEILTIMNKTPEAFHSEFYRIIDEQNGKYYEDGIQRAFEAFLGRGDPIYLSRAKGAPFYEVINGRHRIKVAFDLGWEFIPAVVKDLNQE
jgi:hypothetical protein